MVLFLFHVSLLLLLKQVRVIAMNGASAVGANAMSVQTFSYFVE
jgi:hypothetical protein